jgi:predicted CopG family antitoxin
VPRKGYRTICVTDAVYSSIQQKAKATKRTIPEYIKYLMEKDGTPKENETK